MNKSYVPIVVVLALIATIAAILITVNPVKAPTSRNPIIPLQEATPTISELTPTVKNTSDPVVELLTNLKAETSLFFSTITDAQLTW